MRRTVPIAPRRPPDGATNAASDNCAFRPPDNRQNSSNRPPFQFYGNDRHRESFRPFQSGIRVSERVVERRVPNFVVELRGECGGKTDGEIRDMVEKCRLKPDGFKWWRSGKVGLELYFTEWSVALEGIVCIWELRFDGVHNWLPAVVSRKLLPSDLVELDERLKVLFCERLMGYLKGGIVERVQTRLDKVNADITCVCKKLKMFNNIFVHKELEKERTALREERELISKRLREFRCGVECIIGYLKGNSGSCSGKVFKFDGEFDWGRIYLLITREIKRFDDGLPIYSCRQEIFQVIQSNQVPESMNFTSALNLLIFQFKN